MATIKGIYAASMSIFKEDLSLDLEQTRKHSENLIEKKTVRTVINYLQNFDTKISFITLDTTARSANDSANSLKVGLKKVISNTN